jgi:hypothetical protein
MAHELEYREECAWASVTSADSMYGSEVIQNVFSATKDDSKSSGNKEGDQRGTTKSDVNNNNIKSDKKSSKTGASGVGYSQSHGNGAAESLDENGLLIPAPPSLVLVPHDSRDSAVHGKQYSFFLYSALFAVLFVFYV